MRTTALALVALLTACGGNDYCDRIAKDAENCGETVSDAELQECKDGIANCSKDDMKALDEFYDCASDAGLFECDAMDTGGGGSGTEDFAAVMACISPLMGLSEECGAFGSTGTTTYSYTYGTTTSGE